jgi:hypothetical protein
MTGRSAEDVASAHRCCPDKQPLLKMGAGRAGMRAGRILVTIGGRRQVNPGRWKSIPSRVAVGAAIPESELPHQRRSIVVP